MMMIGIGFLGAALGSFAGAQVWRLRAQQVVYDKGAGHTVDAAELKRLQPLTKKTLRNDRSHCLRCRHELAWHDLLPVVSWLWLRGACRYCRAPIGITELLLEVGMALLFVASVMYWPGDLMMPLELLKLTLWLAALVILAINFVYDLRWSLLVGWLNWALIGCGVVFASITIFQSAQPVAALWSLAGALLILSGLYALLWLTSRGRWVGDGDIYLGAGLALFLGQWPLAFLALFLANAIGTAIVIPLMAMGKVGRGSHLPFGPLLIIGALVAWFVGPAIIQWYLDIMFLS